MKPHIFAQMVNEVRDLAKEYGHTEQFRCRVAEILEKFVQVDHGPKGCRVSLPGIGLCGDKYGAGSGRVQLCPECTRKAEGRQ